MVVSEFWGANIPTTSETLYRGIKADLKDKTSWGCLRRRGCPKPKPEPPAPPVIVVPEPPVGPPVLDDPEPEQPQESNLWLLLVVLGALGGGAYGFVEGYKAEREDKASPTSSKL
jgi:hypothetical protein